MGSKKQTKGKKDDVYPDEAINDNDVEEFEDEDEEEYNVEKILDVKVEKGQKYYLIKWEGYTSDDNTWENENDCDCKDLIEEFYRTRNEKQRNKKKEKSAVKKETSKGDESADEKNNKKRKSPDSSEQQKSKQRKSVSNETKRNGNEKIDVNKNKADEKKEFYKYYVQEGKLPFTKMNRDSWEGLIDCIESIEESDEPITKKDKNDIIKLKVYLRWKDGVRSVHSNQVTNNKCPKKMIEFYENHIRFLKNQSSN